MCDDIVYLHLLISHNTDYNTWQWGLECADTNVRKIKKQLKTFTGTHLNFKEGMVFHNDFIEVYYLKIEAMNISNNPCGILEKMVKRYEEN